MENRLSGCFISIGIFLLHAVGSLAQSTVYPIYTTKSPPPFGLYLSFEDYLNLHPTDTDIVFEHIPQVEGDGINNFYARKPNGKKGRQLMPRACFAGSDGKTFYISFDDQWHKAKRIDSDYYFVALTSIPEVDDGKKHVHIYMTTSYAGGLGIIPLNGYAQRGYLSYKMKFSVEQKKWIPLERARRL